MPHAPSTATAVPIAAPNEEVITASQRTDSPMGIAADSAGNMWVSDAGLRSLAVGVLSPGVQHTNHQGAGAIYDIT